MQINDVVELSPALQKSLNELKVVNTAELSTEAYLKFIDIIGSIRELHKNCATELPDNNQLSGIDWLPDALSIKIKAIDPTFGKVRTHIGRKHVVIDGELFYQDSAGGLHPESQTNSNN